MDDGLSDEEEDYLTETSITRQTSKVESGSHGRIDSSSKAPEKPSLSQAISRDTNRSNNIDGNNSNANSEGWLSTSGLTEEEQRKLFRLMGGKSEDDFKLINKRTDLNYSKINSDMDELFGKGVKKNFRDNKLKGLGNS